MCLIGISSRERSLPVDVNRVGASMVLENSVIFGTVSAARRHYEQAVEALSQGRSGLARRPDQPPRPAVRVAAGAHQAAR